MTAGPESFEIFTLRDTLWSVACEYRKLLFNRAGLRLEEWLGNGRAEIVKRGAGRSIYHVRHPAGEFYIKHFKPSRQLRQLHQRVRRDRAEKEFDVALMMRAEGIPTVRPLALGERRRLGLLSESYLVTEAAPWHQTLFEWIENARPGEGITLPCERQRLARDLARLTAHLHAKGLEHRDLHERNIVVEDRNQSKIERGDYHLRLLDLHELRRHGVLSWRQTLHELARLGRYFSIRTNRTDRLRFLVEYAHARGWNRDQIRARAQEIEAEVIESRSNFWRRRDLRGIRKGSHVWTDPAHGAILHTDFSGDVVQPFLADPNGWLAEHALHWWKRGRSTQVAEGIIGSRRVIVKRYLYHPVREFIAAVARDNPATRAWRNGTSLRLREISTPKPLLLWHRRRWGLLRESFLITECVSEGTPIDRFIRDHVARLSPRERRKFLVPFVRTVAATVRRMHERGVTHPDLKASNLLVGPGDTPDHYRCWLIDLDGVQTWQRVPESPLVQNLGRLAVGMRSVREVSRSDYVRFLKHYLGPTRFARTWKDLWRKIESWGDAKMKRNQRRGRFLA